MNVKVIVLEIVVAFGAAAGVFTVAKLNGVELAVVNVSWALMKWCTIAVVSGLITLPMWVIVTRMLQLEVRE